MNARSGCAPTSKAEFRWTRELSYDLLATIFRPSAPLHDGAVIIRKDRIAAAACFLPLSINPLLSTQLGTRHRAGIGITEETDAISVIVSEETGAISLAVAGNIERDIISRAVAREAWASCCGTSSVPEPSAAAHAPTPELEQQFEQIGRNPDERPGGGGEIAMLHLVRQLLHPQLGTQAALARHCHAAVVDRGAGA